MTNPGSSAKVESGKPRIVKAISLKQPWAYLIMYGKKTIEIRSWNTKFRGELLIHASGQKDKVACEIFNIDPSELPHQALVGQVNLVEVLLYNNKETFIIHKDKHLNPDDFYTKPVYGFVFDEIKRYNTPVPLKGRQGLFDVKIKEKV